MAITKIITKAPAYKTILYILKINICQRLYEIINIKIYQKQFTFLGLRHQKDWSQQNASQSISSLLPSNQNGR